MKTLALLTNATTVSTGAGRPSLNDAYQNTALRTFQASVTGTGAVSATVVVEVSNDEQQWMTLGTITLSGTNAATDGFASAAPWAVSRGNVTAISGTGASVSLTMGY